MIRIKTFDLKKGIELFNALNDEARIRIMNLIFHHQEMCISDLELILDFTQTKTSRHLGFLKNAGILKSKKVDQWVYYFLNPTFIDFVTQIMAFLEKDPTLLNDLKEYNALYSNNELAIRRLHNKQNKYRLPSLNSLK
ncbi:MAG: ArsR family transcriptional regulator [Cytophagales bacterium]|nr:MAG: ArsR family transcriptional regulator [Cytophagales bacterium]